jgi:N-terminal half of MaoC dehydratase
VEPGHVLVFARSVGDVDRCYQAQLSAGAGTPLVTPPTFVRALDHFDPESTTRPTLPRQEAGRGGRSDIVHAGQHFEYVAPFRAGDRVVVESFAGDAWGKDGRSGRLEFAETVTEYRNQHGALLVRARKVSVRTGGGERRA